jgi:site-specific DNA-methyltransferase (cytosine-N4-specific)
MVADELAISLAERFVRPGDSVLDPFCGSGRLLAAAAARSRGRRVGIDINPLACLLTRAKLANADARVLEKIVERLDEVRSRPFRRTLELRGSRDVQWFPRYALAELAQIIEWVNRLRLKEPERLIVASAVSGAARDASYARKDGWKLHRLDRSGRKHFAISAWDSFAGRLRYCVAEVSRISLQPGDTWIEVGDARRFVGARSRIGPASFDIVLTSPPYGDSRTTVQYGAASSLCLDVASRITGLEELFATGRFIDAHCLGGSIRNEIQLTLEDVRTYWAGCRGTRLARAVVNFLADYGEACAIMADCLKPGGLAVLIVGRRSTGGFRLKLDRFTVDRFEALGMRTISIEERRLKEKHLPKRINRYGRSTSRYMRSKGGTRTMSSEAILVFQKMH